MEREFIHEGRLFHFDSNTKLMYVNYNIHNEAN